MAEEKTVAEIWGALNKKRDDEFRKMQKLFGTGRTPSEQDLLDCYLLSFITIKQYLERLSPPTREPEGSGG